MTIMMQISERFCPGIFISLSSSTRLDAGYCPPIADKSGGQ